MSTRMPLRADIAAWAAGIIEGEGCIDITKMGHVRLHVSMSDRDVIESLQARLGGHVNARKVVPKFKPQWVWYIGATLDVLFVLDHIVPWLHERRSRKAWEAIDLLKRRLESGMVTKRWRRGRNKATCICGHPLRARNDGTRICDPCRRKREHLYRQRPEVKARRAELARMRRAG